MTIRIKWMFMAACLTFTIMLQPVVATATENPVAERAPTQETSDKSMETPTAEFQKAKQDYPDPNKIPYRSTKSLLVHLLELPAEIWHLIWTPLGATVIWAEQNRVPQKVADFFYLNDAKTAAVIPLVSVGGNTGAGGGLMAFYNQIGGKPRNLNVSALFSTPANNSATLVYQDSSLFNSSFYFDFTGSYFNDSDENFYVSSTIDTANALDSSIGANNSKKSDETSYATEELGAFANFGYSFGQHIGLGIVSSFRRVDIGRGDGHRNERFLDFVPGVAVTKLFSVGGALTFNFVKGLPRKLSGPLLRLSYTYNKEVGGSRFEFNRFTGEANQFIPIPFMASHRRLALRGIFEKIDRIGEKQIPFYELSMLGDAANLRGFDQNRFRGRGLVLFNLEYRYPVWDTWDAVIFVDQGQVYDDLGDIALSEFHTAIGTGLRFMSATGFLMRFEVARSNEQWRALFQITPNF